MAKPNINSDRDYGVTGHLLTQLDSKEELDKVLQLQKPTIDTSGNPPAQSFWSTGRGCPKCKRTLRMKELNSETGHLKVFCLCGGEWFAEDLENTNEIGDQLHRQIPDDLILRYMAAHERDLDKENL